MSNKTDKADSLSTQKTKGASPAEKTPADQDKKTSLKEVKESSDKARVKEEIFSAK